MRENEEFLEEKFVKDGQTNLGVYYMRFREERIKLKNMATQNPANVMIPPGLQDSINQ